MHKRWLTAFTLLAACAVRTQPPANPSAGIVSAVTWTTTSAEHHAIVLQTFRNAAARLPEVSAGHDRGTWAVIMDGDETSLDASAYMQQRVTQGAAFNDSVWNQFLRTHTLPAMPGAVEFVDRVHLLGGRVVIVTNHAEVVCDTTRENFRKIGMSVDAVLCQTDTSDKNPRFRAVEHGTGTGLPALKPAMFIGDNIRDFPNLTQTRSLPDSVWQFFGRKYFVLPNPMYGSWEHR
jgi:5'-nucleotidase (lipoprotein e(P4) family)